MQTAPAAEPALHVVARRMLLERPLTAIARRVSPAFSTTEVRAQVVELRRETPRATTVILEPNHLWKGFRAGQFAPVTFEVRGVRTTRSYSFSSAPSEAGRLSITVARHPEGKVSRFVNDRLAVGTVVTVGPAAGQLVLPSEPGPVLLVAGGSGVTPMRSLALDLASRGRLGQAVLLHDARTEDDLIFAREFRALADRTPGFVYLARTTGGDDPAARLNADRFASLVPDFAARTTVACGPFGFVRMIEGAFEDAGARAKLRTESFTPPVVATDSEAPAASVTLRRSGIRFEADSRRSLLVQAEAAGAQPKSGCRMGICHTCTCTKRSGTVLNLLTGQVSSEPDQAVQLCISAALSEVDLDV